MLKICSVLSGFEQIYILNNDWISNIKQIHTKATVTASKILRFDGKWIRIFSPGYFKFFSLQSSLMEKIAKSCTHR